METMIPFSHLAAAFIARVFLGLLFFFQGYDAVFKVKVSGVIETLEVSLENKNIPKFMIVLGAWFTSYTELIGGVMLILGIYQHAALYLLGLNLIIASIAFGLTRPMWDMQHVFPRLALLLFLLCIPDAWNYFSADYIFHLK